MTYRYISFIFGFLFSNFLSAQENSQKNIFYKGLSLEKTLKFELASVRQGPFKNSIYYRVSQQGKNILAWSQLGFRYAGIDFSNVEQIISIKEKKWLDSYNLAHGKKTFNEVKGKKIIIELLSSELYLWKLELYLDEKGFAFRYHLPKQKT